MLVFLVGFFDLEAVLVIHVTSVFFFFCILIDNDSEKGLLRLDPGKSVFNSLLIHLSDSSSVSNTLLLKMRLLSEGRGQSPNPMVEVV